MSAIPAAPANNEQHVSVILADLYKELTQLFSGCRLRKDLQDLHQKIVGSAAPDTTSEWIKEAIIRHYQKKFYEQRGLTVPSQVKKNDQAFFSTPPPALDPNEDKKEISMSKKEKKEKAPATEGEAVERKNKTGDTLITLKAGANIDELIKKQKTEHVVALMNIIREAGAKGITVSQLAVDVPKRLKDKTTWEKYKPPVHINYVLKKIKEFVTVSTPSA